MIQGLRRYLGDTEELRLHDFARERPECHLEDIADGHRRWYATVPDAMGERNYGLCRWCSKDAGGAHFGSTARTVLSRRMSLVPVEAAPAPGRA